MELKDSKIVHYCWFGPKPLSKIAKKCIKSWKKYFPDFEIKLWNEDNFDFNQNTFVKEAYEQKKWAFVSDYARLKALSEYGGIYFDTDSEILKDISTLLENNECFLGVEDSGMAAGAIIWAKTPHNKYIDDLLNVYDGQSEFNAEDIYAITIPKLMSNKLLEYGWKKENKEIQTLLDGQVTVYPREYFYPISYDHQDNIFTDNTCMIHYYDATWASKPEKAKLFLRRHNMKFLMRGVDYCVSIKRRLKMLVNVLKGKKNKGE